jgi:hypothetical protein
MAALQERLGVADALRFLQLFGHGSGDYASERHEWVDNTTMDDIEKLARSLHEDIS